MADNSNNPEDNSNNSEEPENASDKRLINRLKSYDPKQENEAMQELLQKHERKITHLFLNRSAKLEDIQEVIQDSLMDLMKNARKGLLDDLKKSLESYFIGICKNKMFDKFNKKPPFQDLDDDKSKEMTNHENALKDMEAKERKKFLIKKIQQLGSSCYEILDRFYYRGQKMKDIAEAMGYANEQVARNKKSKCLKKLRDIIDEDDL